MLRRPTPWTALGIICCLFWSSGALAGKVRFNRVASLPASYPEGPVEIGGRLLVAEMTANRVVELFDLSTRTIWQEADCGPTSISQLGGGEIVVLCHLGGYLAIVSREGKTRKRIYRTADGARIRFPNDSIADGRGGVYISDAGLFNESAPATGKLLYLSPQLEVTRAASGIRYANGVAIHSSTRRLYVSEHLGRRILSYEIKRPGVLGPVEIALDRRAIEAELGPLLNHSGPDGIEFFDEKSYFVAIYGQGAVLHISTAGQVLGRIPVGPKYVTNVSRWRERYVVTGAESNTVFPYAGRIEVYTVR